MGSWLSLRIRKFPTIPFYDVLSMQGYWEIKRKEQRVNLRVQVRLQGLDAQGNRFDEKCYTENVSKSGAMIFTRHQLLLNSCVQIEAFGKFRSMVTIRLIIKDVNHPEMYKIGVEFNGPVNGWIVY
jgi:hypothetical protein